MSQIKLNPVRKMYFLFLFSFFIASSALAQKRIVNSGTNFFVSFGVNDIHYSISGGNVDLILRMNALADAGVTFHFTENSNLDTTIFVSKGEIRDFKLSEARAKACYTGTSLVSSKSVQVTATNPITLVAISSANHSVEATHVWPEENLGTEYIHVGMTPAGNGHSNGYILIATKDNTKITQYTINSGTFDKTLNKGQVYYYYGSNKDERGARIVSDKPIACFQSGTMNIIGKYSNHTFEQVAPVNQWGTKFILPTNETGIGFVRIYPKEIPATVKIKYADKTEESFTIDDERIWYRYKDITIKKTGYMVSDKPISVSTYHVPASPGVNPSQPGVAWLPPIEQHTETVLLSPLDLNSKHVFIKMDHYFSIIVPTASKNKTTISVDGGPVIPFKDWSGFKGWVADSIGGSAYSYGMYYIGESWVTETNPKYLKTTLLIDNPDEMSVLAWGQGAYTNYFYTVGAAARDLTGGFTVNTEDYTKMDGKAYCNTSDFEFKAYPDTLKPIVWMLNGTEIPASDSITAKVNKLQDGYYTVDMLAKGEKYTTHFFVGGSPVIWMPQAKEETEKSNWDNPDNWMPTVVPSTCHNVFIPGNSTHFPFLTQKAKCNNIYFMQGAELGRPDMLAYNRAYVQYNFGLSQTSQIIDNDNSDLVLKSSSTNDRMLYSAAASAPPLKRERWYMLSSPLKGVLTGDLGFGGFPLTFLMKFGPVSKGDKDYRVGNWTTPYTGMTEWAASTPTAGFAFYMYGYGNSSGNNTGCEESGAFDKLNDWMYLPENRSGKNYGIKETNGILELPFFADSTGLYAHRTQTYNPVSNQSTFFYINDGNHYTNDFNKLMEKSETVSREENNENYRFAPEVFVDQWIFPELISHPGKGLGGNDDFMVGNPYMSSLDIIKLLDDNEKTIQRNFKLWDGKRFITYTVENNLTITTEPNADPVRTIAPMQGFFLKTRGDYNSNLYKLVVDFHVENISTTRSAGTPFNLRSAGEEENILRIQAENNVSVSNMLIGYKENASGGFRENEDVQKLFSPFDYVPEIYALADEVPVDITFINHRGEKIVPLGIKTGRTGEIRLTFTGMDHYFKASKIELIDARENRKIDLTGKSSYTYIYSHTEKGIQNGRFSLRFENSMTGLTEISNSDNLKVYNDSKGIYIVSSAADPIQQVIVYDLQGRKVFENTSGASYYPLPEKSGQSPVIVKVMTKNRTKTVKLIKN